MIGDYPVHGWKYRAYLDAPMIEARRAAYIFWHTHSYFPRVPFEMGLKVLEGALAIGRQAEPLGPDEVQTRMEKARALSKSKAPSRASKIKNWLSMKETEPTV